jgi:hypothetical protein
MTTATVQANGSFSASVTLPNQGSSSIVATVTDSFGNTGSSAAVVDTLDNIAPTVTISSAAETSNVAAQTISGTVTSGGAAVVVGQTVTLTDNGTTLGAATIQSDGSFTASVTLPNQGSNSIVASVSDSYGNTGNSAAVVDTLATASPVVSITSEVLADDTGASSTDYVTSDGQVTLTGTTTAGSTVAIFDGAADIGTATVSGTNWTFSTDLGEGAHQLYATATDSDGGTATSAPAHSIVVDDTPPQPDITGVSISGLLRGLSEADSNVQIFQGTTLLGSVTANAEGAWSVDVSSLPTGLYEFTATATDLAGNVGTTSAGLYPVNVPVYAPTTGGGYAWGTGALDIPWQQDGITTLDFGSAFTASQLYLQANSYGDLTLKFVGDNTDSVFLGNDLTDHSGVVESGVGQFVFGDGTVNLGGAMTFTWFGSNNNYSLTGSDFGSNVFDVTTGNGSITFGNSSQGGDGKNTINYDKGDGQADVSLNSGTGVVDFASDVSPQDVYWQADGYGNLFLKFYGDSSDTILVHNDLTDQSGTVVSAVNQLKFSDGTVVNLGGAMTFTWLGNSNNYNLTGSDYGSNLFDIATGNGTITFGNTSSGGDGANTIEYDKGDGQLDAVPNAGTGVIDFASDITPQDVYWQADGYGNLILKLYGDSTDSILVQNDLRDQSGSVISSVNQLQFSDGTVINLGQGSSLGGPMTFTWLGNANNYYLTGSNYGSNVFDITAGSGSIVFGNSSSGGNGTNTIQYVTGDGNADVNLNGGSGVIAFGAGVSAQDVYWQANGYGDLIVKIRGDATDSILVHGDLTNQAGTVTSGIGQLQFSDGSVVNLGQGNPLTFTWLGNSGNYNLTGSTYGSNVFEITTGSGTINFANNSGVGGTNTIKYIKGDGSASVGLNGGTGVIAFDSSVAAQDVYWQANGYGDLIVNIRNDATDSIIIHNDLTSSAGTVTSGISQLQFSDGSVVNLGQSNPFTFTWLGNANNYNLTGSTYGSNVFEITQGNGTINFANNSGVGGKNTIKYIKGDGSASVGLNGGTGVIAFDSSVAAQDVYWQANGYGDLIVNIRNDATDSIIIHNDLTNNAWGVSSAITQLEFSDGTVLSLGQPAAGQGSPLSFTWIGASNSSISGSGFGSNTFELGAGSESFTGGTKSNGGNGNNAYLASANTGQATINPNEASGTMNELDFTGGISDQNLWFIQSGNNLKIDLLGTSTSVTVNGWFSSSSNQLQEITAGGLKIDSQISQLVQAMATYSANNPGFDPTASGVSSVPHDTNLQTTLGAAWHA